LKHKIHRETIPVSLHLFVQPFGRNAIELCEVSIQRHLLPADQKDRFLYLFDRYGQSHVSFLFEKSGVRLTLKTVPHAKAQRTPRTALAILIVSHMLHAFPSTESRFSLMAFPALPSTDEWPTRGIGSPHHEFQFCFQALPVYGPMPCGSLIFHGV